MSLLIEKKTLECAVQVGNPKGIYNDLTPMEQ